MNITVNAAFSNPTGPRAESAIVRPAPSPKAGARSGRIVALASLSRTIPDRLIGDTLARFAHSETDGSVLLVRLGAGDSGVSLRDFAAVRPAVNGEFCFADYLREGEGGFQLLNLRITGEAEESSFVKPLLEHLANYFRFVLLRVGADVSDQVLFECLAHSHLTYLLTRQSQENLYDFDLLVREARSRFNGDWTRLKTVLCLSGGEQARMTAELLRKVGGPLHAFIHDCPSSAADAESPSRTQSKAFGSDLLLLARA